MLPIRMATNRRRPYAVMLVGDSIRMGYQDYLRHALRDLAEVSAPDENCENSRKVLARLSSWIGNRRPDLIHVNCGLHDLRREFGASQNAVPLDEYAANVRAILTQAAAQSSRVVWATTTPVNYAWHHANKEFDRFEEDVAAYNRAALAVAGELGLAVDDLGAAITAAGRDRLLLPDGVHYLEEGYALLGRTAAAMIRDCLRNADLRREDN